MPPDRRKYLWDALSAAELLFDFGAGKTFAAYRGRCAAPIRATR